MKIEIFTFENEKFKLFIVVRGAYEHNTTQFHVFFYRKLIFSRFSAIFEDRYFVVFADSTKHVFELLIEKRIALAYSSIFFLTENLLAPSWSKKLHTDPSAV